MIPESIVYKQCIKKNGQRTRIDSYPKDIQLANRHMKRCSMPLITREFQITTTMRYDLTLDRMAIINKSANNK